MEKKVMVDVDKDELCRLLKRIEGIPCVCPEEEGKGIFYDLRRVEAIDEEIRDSGSAYKWIAGKNYYRLYGQADLETLKKEFSNIILVSSHADNLQEKSNYYMTPDNKYISGCFDNAGTNAVCTYLMKYEYEKLPRNVLFAFTADGKHDLEGAKHVSKKLLEYFGEGNVNVVVLDVTTDLYKDGNDFIFKNNFIFKEHGGEGFIKGICWNIRKSGYSYIGTFLGNSGGEGYIDGSRILSYMLPGPISYFLHEASKDETFEYKENGCSTLSLCLPRLAEDKSQMRSGDGFYISIQQVCNYTDFLCQILQERKEEQEDWGDVDATEDFFERLLQDLANMDEEDFVTKYMLKEDAEEDFEIIDDDDPSPLTDINIYKASEGELSVAEKSGTIGTNTTL